MERKPDIFPEYCRIVLDSLEEAVCYNRFGAEDYHI